MEGMIVFMLELFGSGRETRAYRKINLGGWGQNLNCKFKTFALLDTLKLHIKSNYLAFKQN